jgi:hypothetical protein
MAEVESEGRGGEGKARDQRIARGLRGEVSWAQREVAMAMRWERSCFDIANA